jgi:hypothetical protein
MTMKNALMCLSGAVFLSAGCDTREIQIGVAAENSAQFNSHNEAYHFDYAAIFYNLTSDVNTKDPYAWVQENYLDKGVEVNMALILREGDSQAGNLADILDGRFDEHLHRLADEVEADGRPITLRPLYEGNGDWFPWGAYTEPNDPGDYILAWQHIAEIFADAPVSLDWNMNRRSAGDEKTDDFRDFYPGDDIVDVASISSYNRCGSNSSYTEWRAFSDDFGPAYREIASFVPADTLIAVAETSTTSLCDGDKAIWFSELFDNLILDYPRVSRVTFFFETVQPGEASNDVMINWAPETERQDDAFIAGMNRVRFLFSSHDITPEEESAQLQRGTLGGL